MCQRVTCRQCGKPSFAGCGRRVESVLGDVPPGGAVSAATPRRRRLCGDYGPSTG